VFLINGRNYFHHHHNKVIVSDMNQVCFDNKNVNDLLIKQEIKKQKLEIKAIKN